MIGAHQEGDFLCLRHDTKPTSFITVWRSNLKIKPDNSEITGRRSSNYFALSPCWSFDLSSHHEKWPKMADSAPGIISTILELCGGSVKRHLSYTFKFKSNIRKLQEELVKLEGQREGLQHEIDEELSEGKKIMTRVNDWQTSADKSGDKARTLLQEAENQQNRMCCPNLKRQWHLGRRATKQSQGIPAIVCSTDVHILMAL